MQVFAAFNISDAELVRKRLKQNYEDKFYDDGQCFFVATVGETTQQLASKIGLGLEEPATSGIVIPVTTFYGRYDPNVWEWISANLNANGR